MLKEEEEEVVVSLECKNWAKKWCLSWAKKYKLIIKEVCDTLYLMVK